MGNSDCKVSQIPGIKEVRKEANPLLGNVSEVIITETKQRCLLKAYNISDDSEHRERFKNMKQRKAKNSQFTLNLLRVQQLVNNDFCGTMWRIFCFFQHFQHDLDFVFNEKIHTKDHFTEHELIDIARICINGLIFIQDNELKRCHLSKKTIVMVDRWKILDSYIVQKNNPYFSLLHQQLVDDDVFLAPEILQQLAGSVLDPYMPPKSDVFTLGALLLHIASLQSLQSYFNYDTHDVDIRGLKSRVESLNYSQQFKILLLSMLDQNQQTRPGVITLQEKLSESRVRNTPGDPLTYIPLQPMRKKVTKGSRSSINLLSSIEGDKVRTSDDHCPVYIATPDASPQFKKVIMFKQNSDVSVSDYSTIINQLNRLNNCQLEVETEVDTRTVLQSELAQNVTAESPIAKFKGLLDNTAQESNITNKQFGRLVYSHGAIYEGELLHNLPHGNGILYYKSGKVFYSGGWDNNKFQGFGTLHSECPTYFTGPLDYKDLQQLQKYELRFEGEFNQDSRQGFGSIYYTNGQKFSGCFKNNLAQGYGTYYRRDGSHINGAWTDNKFSRK